MWVGRVPRAQAAAERNYQPLFINPFLLLLYQSIFVAGAGVIKNLRDVRLTYQPPTSSTFLSEQISHQQLANSTFLSEQTSVSHQPLANRTRLLSYTKRGSNGKNRLMQIVEFNS
jgi:hypothetical protein